MVKRNYRKKYKKRQYKGDPLYGPTIGRRHNRYNNSPMYDHPIGPEFESPEFIASTRTGPGDPRAYSMAGMTGPADDGYYHVEPFEKILMDDYGNSEWVRKNYPEIYRGFNYKGVNYNDVDFNKLAMSKLKTHRGPFSELPTWLMKGHPRYKSNARVVPYTPVPDPPWYRRYYDLYNDFLDNTEALFSRNPKNDNFRSSLQSTFYKTPVPKKKK